MERPKVLKNRVGSDRRGPFDKGKGTAPDHVKKPKKPTPLERIEERRRKGL